MRLAAAIAAAQHQPAVGTLRELPRTVVDAVQVRLLLRRQAVSLRAEGSEGEPLQMFEGAHRPQGLEATRAQLLSAATAGEEPPEVRVVERHLTAHVADAATDRAIRRALSDGARRALSAG